MPRSSLFTQISLWVLALALLAVRVDSAHWHLCLDGQEPRASLHVADASVHHTGSDDAADHNDQDVDAGTAAIFKHGDSVDSWVVATAWSLVSHLSTFADEPPLPAVITSALAFIPHLRPPSRGPPR
jgi:hypothetical protein